MLRLCLAIVFVFGFLSQAEMVSTAVGMVRGQAVTSRQVQMDHLLEIALYETKPKSQLHLLGVDSQAFAKAVKDCLLENVVALEAENFNVMQVPVDDVQKSEARARKILASSSTWKDLQVTPAELNQLVHRKLQAKKFIKFRADSSVLPVTDVEAKRYFEENQLKFGDLPFEKFKENIKSYLSKTQVDKRLKDWFDVLLSKYQVKNLISEM